MRYGTLALACLATMALASTSQANIMTSILPQGPIPAGVTLSNPQVSNPPPNANQPASVTLMNVTVSQAYVFNTPFSWRVRFQDVAGNSPLNGTSTYRFTVNLTNQHVHPVSYVSFGIGPVTFTQNVPGGNVGVNQFPAIQNATSTYNTINLNTPNLLIFGGQSGGGGELYNGQTGTFQFDLALGDYSGIATGGFFDLTMVVNPEPTSMALAAFGIAGGAGAMWRRRRKNKQAAEGSEPAVAV